VAYTIIPNTDLAGLRAGLREKQDFLVQSRSVTGEADPINGTLIIDVSDGRAAVQISGGHVASVEREFPTNPNLTNKRLKGE
jgi:hypothetical protein